MKQQQYNTALYMRLSRDDELEGESASISTQDGICQGGFHPKDESPRQIGIYNKERLRWICVLKKIMRN